MGTSMVKHNEAANNFLREAFVELQAAELKFQTEPQMAA